MLASNSAAQVSTILNPVVIPYSFLRALISSAVFPVSFAMTVHGLMDYGLDKQTGKYEAADRKKDLMDEYLKWFCEENAVERNREDTEQRV